MRGAHSNSSACVAAPEADCVATHFACRLGRLRPDVLVRSLGVTSAAARDRPRRLRCSRGAPRAGTSASTLHFPFEMAARAPVVPLRSCHAAALNCEGDIGQCPRVCAAVRAPGSPTRRAPARRGQPLFAGRAQRTKRAPGATRFRFAAPCVDDLMELALVLRNPADRRQGLVRRVAYLAVSAHSRSPSFAAKLAVSWQRTKNPPAAHADWRVFLAMVGPE